LINLNVSSLANLEAGESEDLSLPQNDFRQEFLYAMVKFGLLEGESPSKILGIQLEEIQGLMEVKDIIESANDIMDEEGAIEQIVARLGNLDGNQSIVVSAIIEVPSSLGISLNLACTIMDIFT
jgi:hypothetical protein